MTGSRVVGGMVAALVLVAAVVAALLVYGTPDAVLDDGETSVEPLPTAGDPVLITVGQGTSARDIGDQLAAQGIIRSGRLFEVLAGLKGVQNSLEAGEYEFDRGIPAIEAVNRIAEGRTASRRITFPEGTRVEEMGALLEEKRIVTRQQFLEAIAAGGFNEPFLSQVNPPSLEGFLFPAGYEFSREADASQIVATMLHGFQTNVVDNLQLEGQGLSLYEVITLASIVEREAVNPEEREIIASVFLNRLRVGMPLQADPTVQFALAQDPASVAQFGYWKKDVTLDDLQVNSPYNTYVNPGLPPGPIANPGLASIQAVVRPANTDFLFFVATGDDDGSHAFSRTLEEHEQNIARYQQ
jgi:UPF0755 protein